VNTVDPRIALPHSWRDVYLYDAKKQFVGWVRGQADRPAPAYFTADGLLVIDRDGLGRCKTAHNVVFSVERQPGTADSIHLIWAAGKSIAEYEYASPEDRRGRIKAVATP